MYKCIYTKNDFSIASGEHILQNFLGARWTSTEISSNEAQKQFGETIDVALEQGLKEIRNLLGTKGGRGGPGPSLKNISGTSGVNYTVLPGGAPTIAAPFIKTKLLPDGKHEIQVVMGDQNQLGWALAKISESFPAATFNIDELKPHLVETNTYMNEKLNLRSGLGGDEFFRGALKSVFNLLGVSNTEVALLPILDSVRQFILHGSGTCPNFVHWLTDLNEVALPKLGEFDHFVGVYSKDGNIDGYIQFYGEIGYLIRLGTGYNGPGFSYGYLVDPFRESEPAEIRNPEFIVNNIPQFDSGASLPTELIWPSYSKRFSRILEKYYKRADSKNISRIVEENLLPHQGEIITSEILFKLSRDLAEYITHRIISNANTQF
jgi:hypothetical protein